MLYGDRIGKRWQSFSPRGNTGHIKISSFRIGWKWVDTGSTSGDYGYKRKLENFIFDSSRYIHLPLFGTLNALNNMSCLFICH